MSVSSAAPAVSARIETAALASAHVLSRAGLLLLLAYAAATLCDGMLRSFANAPIDAVRDLGDLTVAVAISCCFPQGFLERRNIVISFIEKIVGIDASHRLDVMAAAAVAVVLFLFAWQFAVYARGLAAAQEMTALLEVPKAPFWFVVDANLWLTFAAQVIVLARSLAAPAVVEA